MCICFQDSLFFFRKKKLCVIGGLVDSDSSLKRVRKDVLMFDTSDKSWYPPVKKVFTSSSTRHKKLSVEDVCVHENRCYALFQCVDDKGETSRHIDEIPLDCLDRGTTKPSTRCVSKMPDWLKAPCSLWWDGGIALYAVSPGGGFGRLNLTTSSWERLQKPIGELGSERSWLAGVPSSLFLLTGRPASGDSATTNYIQVTQLHNILYFLYRFLFQPLRKGNGFGKNRV